MSFEQHISIFIDLFFPRTKPISIVILCEPPNQLRFLEQIITEFEELNRNDENYFLGDYIINLPSKGKYILDKPNEIRIFHKELSPEIRKYTGLCSTNGLKQLIY